MGRGTPSTEDRDGAADVVTQLREDELQNLRAQLDGGSRDVALKNLDERGIAQELIRQQYSGRYPFELLQNADDAAAEGAERAGSVARFIVTESALVVADMGLGFGDQQIRAICSLGRTSKDPRKTIGYKGLGFKSVEEITERPQVVSGAHRFMFDRGRTRQLIAEITGPLDERQRVPVYAYPLPVEQADLGGDVSLIDDLMASGFHSIIRLPFRDDVTRAQVSRDVGSMLSPRILLFLQATERLEVEGASADFVATRVTEEAGVGREILLEVGPTTEHWLVFERHLPVTDPTLTAPLGDMWAEVDEVRVAMAVPLTTDGRPGADETFPLHVHFPTEEVTALPAILQGDFVLDIERKRLSTAPEVQPYNSWLSRELAAMVATEVAPYLAARFPMDASVVSALSPHGDAMGFGEHLLGDYVEALLTSRYLPAIDGRPRMASEALLRPPLPDPTAADGFLELGDAGNLVLADVEREAFVRSFLADHLEVRTYEPEDLIDRLKPPDASEARGFYEWLVSWAESLPAHRLARLLQHAPCVLTTSGAWRHPGSGVFFPRARGDPGTPDMAVEIAALPEVEDLDELLRDAGVRPLRWRELLLDIVLPRLTSPDTSDEERMSAHRTLRSYFEAESRGDLDIVSRVGAVLVLAAKAAGGQPELRPARDTYFSSAWVGHGRLETIYGPFDQPEFFAEVPPTDSDERTELFRYMEQLGVARRPRIDTAAASAQARYLNLSYHPHRTRYGVWWQRWQGSQPFQEASSCGQNHTASQQLAASHGLDRFPGLLDASDRSRLEPLFMELAAGWGAAYSAATTAAFHCNAQNHAGERDRLFPSLMMFMLLEAAWLPALRDGESVLERPPQTWRLSAGMSQYAVPFLSLLEPSLEQDPGTVWLSEALNVIDGARPKARDVCSLLRSISEKLAGDGDMPTRWDSAARWAMWELDASLSKEQADPATLEDTPLLASLAGELIFHTRPYVYEDHQLAEAWEDELPLYRGDKDLTRLIARFGLPRLERAVRTMPIVAGLSPTNTRRVKDAFEQAAPYLSALASEAQSSRADAIRSRLRFLELQACDDLALTYSLDGQVRERSDPTTFLTWDTVREGSTQRRIGTGYLETDAGGRPDWYAFGPQLADYLEVQTQRDSFALVLEADQAGRDAFMRSRGLSEGVVREREALNVPEPPVEEWLPPVGASAQGSQPGSGEGEGEPVTNAGGSAPSDGAGTEAADATDERATPEVEVLPPLDAEGIRGVDVSPALVDIAPDHRGEGGGSGGGRIDWEHLERMRRTYGRRGEQAAIAFERRRVAGLGFDPDEVVIWESELHELATYDIRSVDSTGGVIYIEVKAAAAADESSPFEISAPELSFGMSNRPRYYVYRVIDVRSANPTILRYHDPIGAIERGHGAIRVTGAKMYLAPDPEEVT